MDMHEVPEYLTAVVALCTWLGLDPKAARQVVRLAHRKAPEITCSGGVAMAKLCLTSTGTAAVVRPQPPFGFGLPPATA